MNMSLRAAVGASLLLALGAGSTVVFAQQEQGRVISSMAIRTPDGIAGYSVTYEYAGRQYTTRTDAPPGKTIALQVTPMGVATSSAQDQMPYADDAGAPPAQVADNGNEPWRTAVPEPGVVVSGTGAPPAVYPAPAYAYPAAPVYVAPPYGYGYGYGYGYPYAYPPVGVSLNLGYSRGWGGGYYRRGWR